MLFRKERQEQFAHVFFDDLSDNCILSLEQKKYTAVYTNLTESDFVMDSESNPTGTEIVSNNQDSSKAGGINNKKYYLAFLKSD